MTQKSVISLPNIRNITVSGRIGSGATTLAKQIAETLGWEFLEGGEIAAAFFREIHANESDVALRPDSSDLEYEEQVKQILTHKNNYVIQSHLAGFDAQNIAKVFKILTVCEDENEEDKMDIRIDRLVNRKGISVEEAKAEVHKREEGNLIKWRRLYMNNDTTWVYWDKKYYDFVVNTFSHNQIESLRLVLEKIGYQQNDLLIGK